MSMYKGLVDFRWDILEKQPMYIKTKRSLNEKQGYRIEVAIDRSSTDENLRGESFYVYGRGIEDVPENTDISMKVNSELSSFMNDGYGFKPYIVVNSLTSLGTKE